MLAIILLILKEPPKGEIVTIVIVLGWVLAAAINIIVNFFYIVRLILRKPLKKFIPLWLMITNFIFLILQLILFLR
ncbi:MAG: hypothetical protein JST75_17985 [Bacteroidetes bacterium]|nr:hypothetical protein [Bacteroidota bacterium]